MRVGFYTEAGESELFYNEMFFFLVLLFMSERTNEPFVHRHGLTEIPPK